MGSWDERSAVWDETVSNSPVFQRLREELIEAANPSSDDRVLDLGAGAGFVALRLAPLVEDVVAVDSSSGMLALLADQADARGLGNVRTLELGMQSLECEPGSFSLVVSHYALHYLNPRDQRDLVQRVFSWLEPGGRVVFVDMMFGRSAGTENRAIAGAKIAQLLRHGPGGLWRVIKNVARLALGFGLYPSSRERWESWLTASGFEAVEGRALWQEAGLVSARRPGVVGAERSTKRPASASQMG